MLAQSLVEYGALASALRGTVDVVSSAASSVLSLGTEPLLALGVVLAIVLWLLFRRT
jgi:hypothetical protein